jgi:ABC-type bacteriocin/lantibiotic exporter with double-glycine peptidase domain
MQSDLNEFLPLLATFTVASLRLFPISNSFLSNIITIRANKNSIDRLHQVKKSLIDVRLKKDEKDFNNIEFEKFKNLKISNLYFRYNKENRYIFKNLNLTFESEKVVGIFGESGSGKSTLVDLITGILIPDSGYIKINDKDLNENLILIKKLTSYMPQQIFLIDGTIQENIALGEDKENINNEKLFGSIKKAELDNLINDLPEGIHTKIGDNGIRLSGGQRQRIGLARSFYFEKQILILDEATNALDELIERSILDNIIKNKKNSLIIIISHNKETLKECDEIYEIIEDNIKLKFKK